MAILRVRLQPRASRNEAVGFADGVLRVRLTAPPVEGAANKALIEFVAELLGVKRGDVSLASGRKSREKTLEIAGLTDADIGERIVGLRVENWETGT